MKTNPKARKFEIGIREIREITIWPLSLADEISFSEKIVSLVDGFDKSVLSDGEPSDVKATAYIIEAIQNNLVELLVYVTDDKVSLSDLDNEQFVDLCTIIFEMNFDGAAGKIKRLLNRIKNLFPQKTPLENLSSTPVTDTNTSTDSDTEMVE